MAFQPLFSLEITNLVSNTKYIIDSKQYHISGQIEATWAVPTSKANVQIHNLSYDPLRYQDNLDIFIGYQDEGGLQWRFSGTVMYQEILRNKSNFILNISADSGGLHNTQKIPFDFGKQNSLGDMIRMLVYNYNKTFEEAFPNSTAQPLIINEIPKELENIYTEWGVVYSKEKNYTIPFNQALMMILNRWGKSDYRFTIKNNSILYFYKVDDYGRYTKKTKAYLLSYETGLLGYYQKDITKDGAGIIIRCLYLPNINEFSLIQVNDKVDGKDISFTVAVYSYTINFDNFSKGIEMELKTFQVNIGGDKNGG